MFCQGTKYRIVQIILICLTVNLHAQGLLLDHEAYDRLPRQPVYSDGSKAENNVLDTILKVDLRPYCPKPGHQGSIGSCSGWATGYGARTILEAIRRGWKGKTDSITAQAYSALFIYNQVKAGSCAMGAYIDKAAELLRDKGDILSSTFDGELEECERQPTDEQLKEASAHRIEGFVTLFSSDAARSVKVEKTKLSLAQGRPVAMGLLLRKNFMEIKKGDQYWFPDLGDTTFYGAHAMVVVGYDDSKNAFEIMNSWGEDWGNGGFVWVKYADFARFCCYGFQLIPYDDPSKHRIFEADVQFRNPFLDEADNLRFEDYGVLFDGKFYYQLKEKLSAGDKMQLHLPYVTQGSYLYVFSYDTKRKIKVHWPRDGSLDAKFSGKNESAVITVSDINLAIPGEWAALSFSSPGTEYICVLVARQPLEHLNDQLTVLQNQPGSNFMHNLYKAFEKELAEPKTVTYKKDGVGFTGSIEKGTAVPIVLKVTVQ